MNNKFLLLLLSVLLGTFSCFAQNTLNIHQKTGSVVSYSFSEKPVVTYVDDNLHVATEQVSIDYPLAELEKMTFSESEASIRELKVESNDPVSVFRLDGTLVKRAENQASFDTKDLSAGTYIIKQGTITTKLIKR